MNLPCELGGGIRNEQTIRELLDMGLCRLVIGTLAIRAARLVSQHVPAVSPPAGPRD